MMTVQTGNPPGTTQLPCGCIVAANTGDLRVSAAAPVRRGSAVSGSAMELLRWYAANDPARLDELAVMAATDLDDPSWTTGERERVVEARRRLLDRIAELREAR